MRVRVGLTPQAVIAAPVAIAIDVLRCTSTICQAMAAGVGRVTCVGEVADARALAGAGVALAGERHNMLIPGFDFGNSPREFQSVDRSIDALVMTTTNGTRLLVDAAARCETVYVGSLLNLAALVDVVSGEAEVALLCAGVEGEFAIDDAYVAGRFALALGGEPDDAAVAAMQLARSFASAESGIGAGISAENLRVNALGEDIVFCARESVIDLAPRVIERGERAVVIGENAS